MNTKEYINLHTFKKSKGPWSVIYTLLKCYRNVLIQIVKYVVCDAVELYCDTGLLTSFLFLV